MNLLTMDGITQPITEWALDYGIYPAVIADRLARGWTVECAITLPMLSVPGQHLHCEHLPGLPPLIRSGNHGQDGKRWGKRYLHNSRCLTIPEWSEELGIHSTTIRNRIRRGLPIAQVLTKRAPTPSKMTDRGGVVQKFLADAGTGGGSLAQDFTEIEFSE